jgi:hypothetical protein
MLLRGWVSASIGLALCLCSGPARAQLSPLEEGMAIGEWRFQPSLELRLRGEYRRHPVDTGGDVYGATAVQSEGYRSRLPEILERVPAVDDEIVLSERARLGLEVSYDVVTAKLSLQDARVLGVAVPAVNEQRAWGAIGPWEAWLDLRSDLDDPWLWVRVGRQPVTWGDGRLLGENDWSHRPNALDAARAHLSFGDLDVEILAAMLALPGPVPPPYADYGAEAGVSGTGAQLYGLDLTYRVVPLFAAELMGLARIDREPLPPELARGDTFTVDLRLFGDHRGFRYAAEGAVQLGKVAGYGVNRDILAFAAAGLVDWQTALPGDFRFGLHGGYASGDDAETPSDDLNRFDPIAPDTRTHHGLMNLYAWSNVIEAGGSVAARPHEVVTASAGYAFVGLAEPGDRWSTANLVPVGAAPENEDRILGHEVDLVLAFEPWDEVTIAGGYGLFVLGGGGKAIAAAAGRGDRDLLHYAFLQAEVVAP